MVPRLSFTCSERWDEMPEYAAGRYCGACAAHVPDLASFSAPDLVSFLKAQGGAACGRVRPELVERTSQLPEIWILRPVRPVRPSPSTAWLLAASGLLFASCGATGTTGQDDKDGSTGTGLVDRTGSSGGDADPPSNGGDGEREEKPDQDEQRKWVDPPPPVGMLELDCSMHSDHACIPPDPDTPAEFPGGMDSLYAFMLRHVQYPVWEAEKGITGRVVVTFTVTEQGAIEDARIIRDVPGARHLGAEVLRVVGLMPPWSPATLRDVPTKSKMSLPVMFRL